MARPASDRVLNQAKATAGVVDLGRLPQPMEILGGATLFDEYASVHSSEPM